MTRAIPQIQQSEPLSYKKQNLTHKKQIIKQKSSLLNANMKRTCSSHKQAEYLCISQQCKQKCSYLCSLPYDQCKQQHEGCNLISLNYVLKKCNKITGKQENFQLKQMQKIVDQAKKMIGRFENFFQQRSTAQQIKLMLDPHGLIEQAEKKVLIEFLRKNQSRKVENQEEGTFSAVWFERQLVNLNIQISAYLKMLKEDRRLLEEQTPMKELPSSLKVQSKIQSSRKPQTQRKQGSAIDKIRSQSKGPTPVRGSNSQVYQSQISPTKSKIKKIQNPALTSNGFQSKLSSTIKGHVPIGPLFSKITNNIQTLQTFFYEKFTGASLLYRASENDFSVNKFHQKCDGVKNTLTIIITEHDKIIGGFTPVPWKSSGDWITDETESSFIFSLSLGQRFPLLNKSKAIWCNHAYGPSFGYPDLQIANKAFYNQNSCVNFPQFYNNGNFTQNPASIQLLCGTKTGHFRIKEWQVYELQF